MITSVLQACSLTFLQAHKDDVVVSLGAEIALQCQQRLRYARLMSCL